MAGTSSAKVTGARDEYWRERIAAQERSGLTVQQFCKEHGLNNPTIGGNGFANRGRFDLPWSKPEGRRRKEPRSTRWSWFW